MSWLKVVAISLFPPFLPFSAALCLSVASARSYHNSPEPEPRNKNLPNIQHKSPSSSEQCTVHVGNLDWNCPVEKVTSMMHAIVGNRVVIDVTPIKLKLRDQGKHHGGSATMAFATHHEALVGMELATAHNMTWRVRWAWTPPKEKEPIIATAPPNIQKQQRRAQSAARNRLRRIEVTQQVIQSASLTMSHHLFENMPVLDAPKLDWSNCPFDPLRSLPASRGLRKQAAVEAFLFVLQSALLLEPEQQQFRRVADLGCGTGHLTLPLAWFLQDQGCVVVGVDMDGHALELLRQKSTADGGGKVETMQQEIQTLDTIANCSAVVSLHACGSASDWAMAVAISHSIPFAISPCCIGKFEASLRSNNTIKNNNMILSYPRSQRLSMRIKRSEYQLLAAAADYGVSPTQEVPDDERDRQSRGRRAKQLVELDRLEWAKELDYDVRMVELPRLGPWYPKRELLLGAKKGTIAAYQLANLRCTSSGLIM